MTKAHILIAVMLFAASCADARAQDDVTAWGRVDCKSAANAPDLRQAFERDKAVCVAKAESAGRMGSAAMPVVGQGIGSGIQRGMAAMEIEAAALRSCMADRGYLLERKSQFAARCR